MKIQRKSPAKFWPISIERQEKEQAKEEIPVIEEMTLAGLYIMYAKSQLEPSFCDMKPFNFF